MNITMHAFRSRFFNCLIAAGAGVLLAVSPPGARGQSDNFDDGDDAGWNRVNILTAFGGVNTYSFPNGPFGKAYRIQCTSSPVTALGNARTARAFVYRTNEYTDFYISVDLINWDNTLDQALVLLGRATGLTNQLSPCPLPSCPPGLGTINGYVCNYDPNQDGTGSGDMRGGQFQINRVVNEAPSTIAGANVTLNPGKNYRMILKGVADLLTAQLYDLDDLSAPLVTIQANDASFTGGVCGLTSFSRDATTSDVTFDNYYAAVSDPNADIAPAIRHPVPGTPQVVTRTPQNRFSNFVSPSSPVTFTASTFATNEINSSATRLYLNGVDFSSSLVPLPPNGTSASFTAAGVLVENTVYTGRIELQNTTGGLKSTNIFWFDTFSDSYLTNGVVKTIEAEDYNYSGGSYQVDPIPASGYDTNGVSVNGGTGYWEQTGTPEIDYHDNRVTPEGGWNEYRSTDFAGTLQGNRQELQDANHLDTSAPPVDPTRFNDTTRHKYEVLGLKEYGVARTEAGEWLNYTRAFADTNYYVFLRCGSYGAVPIQLDLVGGDITTTNQTTTPLGTFQVQNHFAHFYYRYEPLLKTGGGGPVVVHLAGTNTLRLTVGGTPIKDNRALYLNYLLFVPTSAGLTVFDNFNDGNDTTPAWTRLDPLSAFGAGGTWSFPGGNSYRMQAPQTPNVALGPGRAASILAGSYDDFYESVDILAWNDNVREAFGLLARVTTPGLGTTSGYLFSYERGDPNDPAAGDLDISRVDGETPHSLPTTGSDKVHLQAGKQYRLAFIGAGDKFTGNLYELPDTSNPIRSITATDSAYASGQAGLVVANNNTPSYAGAVDVTFDNFLVTTAEPRLSISLSGIITIIIWPRIPFALQSSPSLTSPVWTTISSGITQVGDQNSYSAPVSGAAQFFRLVYP